LSKNTPRDESGGRKFTFERTFHQNGLETSCSVIKGILKLKSKVGPVHRKSNPKGIKPQIKVKKNLPKTEFEI